MSFAWAPTDRTKSVRGNYVHVCSNNNSMDLSPSNLHQHNRHSTVSLTSKESLKLTAALQDLILQPGQNIRTAAMPMKTRSSQPSPVPVPMPLNPSIDSSSAPTNPPEPAAAIPPKSATTITPMTPSGAKELVITERVTEDGVRLRKYSDGRVVALSLPPKLQIPSGNNAIFAALYQGIPNHPVEDGAILPSPIQILQAWVALNPITWPADDPYFTRTSTLDGVAWHVNSKTLELVLSSIEVLRQSLNEVYDLLINIPILHYDPDSDNKMIDHLRNRRTFPAVRFADVMYKQRVEKSLDHIKVLKTLFAKAKQSLSPPLCLLCHTKVLQL
jgi:hypothetical protein